MTRYMKGGRQMVSLRIDPELWKELERVSVAVNRSRSELLEEAARAIIKRYDAAKPVQSKRR